MGALRAFPQLDDLRRAVAARPGLQLWLFGSALTVDAPADLDVLLVYSDLTDVAAVRSAGWWIDTEPPIDLLAMTHEEEREYSFIENTRALRLV